MDDQALCQRLLLLLSRRCLTTLEIADEMTISDQCVQRYIDKLISFSCDIVQSNGRWSLNSPKEPLASEVIRSKLASLNTAFMPQIIVVASCDSTNSLVCQLSDTQCDCMVLVAEHQSAGRGRRSHQWYSPFGQNIYFSLRVPLVRHALSGLSLAICVTVAQVLSGMRLPLDKLSVKWPNDVLFDHKKIAGILVELIHRQSGVEAVIGIGINVNMGTGCSIDQPWTSMQHHLGTDIDRNHLVALLIATLSNDLHCFERDGLNPFLPQWRTLCCLKNRYIFSEQLQNMGIYHDIDEQGRLFLKQADGALLVVDSGSIRMV